MAHPGYLQTFRRLRYVHVVCIALIGTVFFFLTNNFYMNVDRFKINQLFIVQKICYFQIHRVS